MQITNEARAATGQLQVTPSEAQQNRRNTRFSRRFSTPNSPTSSSTKPLTISSHTRFVTKPQTLPTKRYSFAVLLTEKLTARFAFCELLYYKHQTAMVEGNPVPKMKSGSPLTSIAQEAKAIIQCLEGVFHAFESAVIGSDDYRDKAMLVHKNISALAKLHPNWSDERKVILDKRRHDAPPLDETSPFILIHEYSEVMFRAWHQMRVPQPSIRTLAQSGDTFRQSLASLKDECNELTNRKHHKLPAQTDSIPATDAPVLDTQTAPATVPQNAEKEGNL